MYYVQDAHSFWDWIYFVLLIVVCGPYPSLSLSGHNNSLYGPQFNQFQIGSFFMINLCLVVIATQFSETKKREMERMRQERARFTSSSTLASSTNNSEPTSCYAEIVKYIAHLWRRLKRRMIKKLRLYKYGRSLKTTICRLPHSAHLKALSLPSPLLNIFYILLVYPKFLLKHTPTNSQQFSPTRKWFQPVKLNLLP